MSLQMSPKLPVSSHLVAELLANCYTDEVPQQQNIFHYICCRFAEPLVSCQ